MESQTIILVSDYDPSLVEIFTSDDAIAQRLLAAGAVQEHIPFPPNTLRGILYSRYDQWLVCYHQQLKFRALDLIKRSGQSREQLAAKVKRMKVREQPYSPLSDSQIAYKVNRLAKKRTPREKRKRERRSDLTEEERLAARAAEKAARQRQWERMSPQEQEVWRQNRRRKQMESQRRRRDGAASS